MEKMKLRANWVAHFQDILEGKESDRIYIVSIHYMEIANEFYVYGVYGNRGAYKFTATIRSRKPSFQAARIEAEKLFQNKLNSGYKDVSAVDYDGLATVESVGKFFQNNERLDKKFSFQDVFPGLTPDKDTFPEEFEESSSQIFVTCINNMDLEDNFDLDITYPLLSCDGDRFEDSKSIVVEDRFGREVEVSKTRFKL